MDGLMPFWFGPLEGANWRLTRRIEQEFIRGVDEMGMGKGRPKLRMTGAHGDPPAATLTRRGAAAKKTTVYVAVVVRGGFANYPYASKYDSGRSDGGWFALMGEDKDKLIEEALTKAKAFGGFRTYEVAVGVLDEMVVTPMVFKVVKL